ncbi:MAG: ABC transporter ATP-binding protein [Actinomycetales bacterium]
MDTATIDRTVDETVQLRGFLAEPPRGALARLMAVLRFNRRAMAWTFIGTVVASLVSLVQPAVAGMLVSALRNQDFAALLPVGGALLAAALVASGLTAAVNLTAARAGNQLVRDFRDAAARLSLRVPAEKLVDHPAADLVARCSIDSERMGEVYTRGPIQALGGIVLVSGALVQMTIIDPVLTLSALALTLTCLAIIMLASKRLTGISFDRQEAQGEYVSECTRALGSVLTLRAFVADAFAIRRLSVSSQRLLDASNRSAKANAFMAPLVTIFIQATLLVIVCIAVLRVHHGSLSVEHLVAFFMYTMMMIGPIAGSAETAMLMAETLGALQRIINLGDVVKPAPALKVSAEELAALEAMEAEPKGDPEVVHGQLSFRNVSVRYAQAGAGGREFALQDVSFDVPRGAWVALTGSSGSGKSTLLSLMEKFVVPSQGLVLVDGIPLDQREDDVYRSQVGYIEQSCPLFSGTVRDNLLLGRDGIDDARCWDILEKVGLTQAISARAEGLDAPVGESAYAFSGGERQRLAIARTLLGEPRMLLLDEITSGLDVVNREQIMGLIRTSMSGITTLASGHGRYGIDTADLVLVLDRGRLVDAGPPAEVRRRSALFRALVAH